MTNDKLYINGKLVTETNAWRFVKARRPNAEATRETSRSFRQTTRYSLVRDRTGGAPWCNATGKTAGEAWLKVARQMVEYDTRIAAEKLALEDAVAQLRLRAIALGESEAAPSQAQLEAAALRYAAIRIEQSGERWSDERERWATSLRSMADAMKR